MKFTNNILREFLPRESPFLHIVGINLLSRDELVGILFELDSLVWKKTHGPFYRFSFPTQASLSDAYINYLKSLLFPEKLHFYIEKVFSCRLSFAYIVELHKYDEGDVIGPHTDNSCREIRLVVNLIDFWTIDMGGIWILAKDSALKVEPVYLPPLGGSAFCFKTGEASFHALAKCGAQHRYCAVVRVPFSDVQEPSPAFPQFAKAL